MGVGRGPAAEARSSCQQGCAEGLQKHLAFSSRWASCGARVTQEACLGHLILRV